MNLRNRKRSYLPFENYSQTHGVFPLGIRMHCRKFRNGSPRECEIWISSRNRNAITSLKGKNGLSQPWAANYALPERHQTCIELPVVQSASHSKHSLSFLHSAASAVKRTSRTQAWQSPFWSFLFTFTCLIYFFFLLLHVFQAG